ncbi:MAG: hypothetical protein JO082_15835 [Mycobacterium sp.]|nr:hypothetical protein [Mycobacterium sp.]MBV9723373.1 hypothetical protein [Mycobacterium sp.]
MTIKVALVHRTSYTFDRPVRVSSHIVPLRSAPHSRAPRRARQFELELSNVREKQARRSTDIGAPRILDLRPLRTVLR